MVVQKFSLFDAELVRSPGQDADIFVGNLVDERHGGPVTIGYGRYAPGQSLTETMAVHDTMIILEGRLSVSTGDGTVAAGPGDIVYMPKGESVTITTEGEGALTAYVTYPHWAEAHERWRGLPLTKRHCSDAAQEFEYASAEQRRCLAVIGRERIVSEQVPIAGA